MASQNGHYEVLASNIPPTPKRNSLLTKYGQIVRYLIGAGARLDFPTNKGAIALTIAAERGVLPVVELLVESGCNTNTRSNDGVTPLFR